MTDEPRYTMPRVQGSIPCAGTPSPFQEVIAKREEWMDKPTEDGWYWVCKPGWIKNNPRWKWISKIGDTFKYSIGDRLVVAAGDGKLFHGPHVPPKPPENGGEYWPPP